MNKNLWVIIVLLNFICCSCALVSVNDGYGLHARLLNEQGPIQEALVNVETRGKVHSVTTDYNGLIKIPKASSTKISWLGGPSQSSLLEQHYLISVAGYEQVRISYYRSLPSRNSTIDGRSIKEENGIILIGDLNLNPL